MLAQSLSSSSSPNMPEKKPGTAFSENNPLSIATTGRSKVKGQVVCAACDHVEHVAPRQKERRRSERGGEGYVEDAVGGAILWPAIKPCPRVESRQLSELPGARGGRLHTGGPAACGRHRCKPSRAR